MASRARIHKPITEAVAPAVAAPTASIPERPIRQIAVPKSRTCQDFLDYWMPRIRSIADCVELDYSFALDAITATDMRSPSALRTAMLYSRHEVLDGVDREPGEFEKRIHAFLAMAPS